MELKAIANELQYSSNTLNNIQSTNINNIDSNEDENNNNYTEKQIQEAISRINRFLKSENTYAEYSMHEKIGRVMVKIIDQNTKEVLMECPPKKIVDLVANLMELSGVAINKKA